MNYKIIIDASHGGDDIGSLLFNIPEKNISLELSKYMYQKFKRLNIPVSLVREKDETISPYDRLKRIEELYGDHKYVIVISNHIYTQKEYEIIYGIHHTSDLSNKIASFLLNNGEQVKCHTKRLGFNAHLDYYPIHRNVANMKVIRISHPFVQNRSDLDKGVDQIVNAVYEYIGGKIDNDLYEVVKGDTMWSVAKKFNLGVEELKSLNGFADNLLRTGDKIKVSSNEKEIYYTVGRGENLYQISKKFNIDLEKIMQYNCKKSNLIQMGEIIRIPSKDGISHTIQKGENLYQLSKKYQTSVQNLMKKNGLKDSKVEIGSIIAI